MILNGIDVVEIDRIKKSMENPQFLDRFFTENERNYFASKNMNPQSVAASFAAKEAFSKAIGTGIRNLKLSDIGVCHDLLGRPYFEYFGKTAEIAKKRKLDLSLSITHTEKTAIASVFGTGEPMYKTIIFDLDGTLLNTSKGVLNSVKYALDKMGLEQLPLEKAKRFIGPPLQEGFEGVAGLKGDDIDLAVFHYRENYKNKGAIFEAEVYDGIEAVLKHLKNDGRKICVATLKPEDSAKRVLEHFGLAQYFDYIGGNKEEKSTKAGLIAEGLAATNVAKDEAVLIGDSIFDLYGAQEAGVDFIAAAYGFGPDEGFPEKECVAICDHPHDFVKYL